jgi:hypothetical protein
MLTYKRIDIENSQELGVLFSFITDHYRSIDNFYLSYSYKLFEFFVKGIDQCIPIMLYSNRVIIGCIIGTIRFLSINSSEVKSVDVDFLCVNKYYRGQNLAPILIELLQKEFEKYHVSVAICTIADTIPKYSNFLVSTKQIYHRIVTLEDKVYKNPPVVINGDRKVIDTRSALPSSRPCSGSLEHIGKCTQMHHFVNSFLKRKYDLFDKKSLKEFKSMFENPVFYHFFFDDSSYFCFYYLDLINTGNKERHYYLYTYALNDPALCGSGYEQFTTMHIASISNYFNSIRSQTGSDKQFITLVIDQEQEAEINGLGFKKGTGTLNLYVIRPHSDDTVVKSFFVPI